MDNNTHYIFISSTSWGSLDQYPNVPYKDGFFLRNVDFISTFSFPTTTYFGVLTSDVPIFTSVISGGPMNNFSYDDFSRRNSVINTGLYFCTPTLIVSLSSFEETVSPIVKIIYEQNSKITTFTPFLSVQTISAIDNFVLLPPKNNVIVFNFSPGEKYSTVFETTLSVIRLDSTVNTFTFVTSVLQCGLFDVHDSVNVLNSQILDKSNYVLLTLENQSDNRVFNSIIDTSIPFIVLTGGDTVNLETFGPEPQTVFDLEGVFDVAGETFVASQIRQLANVAGVVEPIIPEPLPKINPIIPRLAEYYYRGIRGIVIRPLLARLLPGQEFFYASPGSGLVILSGGAPYYPGTGINLQIGFRDIGS